MSKLNLGSGNDYQNGYTNVDNNGHSKSDIVHNLNKYPYPFPDNQFEEILANHIIEHLDSPLNFLQEIYRISKNGAKLTMRCPHFSCNWLNPTHKSCISTKLFNYLDKNNPEYYKDTNFEVKKVILKWMGDKCQGKRKIMIMRLFNSIINLLANIDPAVTERIWCYWVGGFEEIVFEVKVIKSS